MTDRHDPRDHELGLTYRQRERMASLRRRRAHLAERTVQYREDGDPARNDAELSALNWAIRIIENAAIADVLKEVE